MRRRRIAVLKVIALIAVAAAAAVVANVFLLGVARSDDQPLGTLSRRGLLPASSTVAETGPPSGQGTTGDVSAPGATGEGDHGGSGTTSDDGRTEPGGADHGGNDGDDD